MIQTKEVSIYEIEQRATKNQKTFWAIQTNKGEISTWSIDVAKEIQEKCLGMVCSVGVKTTTVGDKTYTNVVGVDRILGNAEKKVDNKQQTKVDIGESARLRRRTDCMICAKDLVIAKIIPIDELIKKSIELVDWVEGTEKTEEEILDEKVHKLIDPKKAFS